MASLQEVCELAWRQLYPNGGGDEAAITKEEFIASGRYEYAYQHLLMSWKIKLEEGWWELPSYLVTEVEKDIVDNVMDISDIKTFKGFSHDIWLIKIGDDNCNCKYVKTTINLNDLLCGDDSLDDAARTYYVVGKKIKFPRGVHKSPLSLVYANMGGDIDGTIDVDEAVAALVRVRLIDIYAGKTGQEDVTNNTSSNN